MSKFSRDKGRRIEQKIKNLLLAIGIKAELVPLSGAVHFRNTKSKDLDFYPFGKDEAPWVAEIKGRANGEGFKTLGGWLSDADALFLVRDRQPPLVVMPFVRASELFLSAQRSPVRATVALREVIEDVAQQENAE